MLDKPLEGSREKVLRAIRDAYRSKISTKKERQAFVYGLLTIYAVGLKLC